MAKKVAAKPRGLSIARRSARSTGHPPCRLGKILFIDFEADEFFHAAALGSHGGISDTEKRIEHHQVVPEPVQPNATRREFDRKCRRMGTIRLSIWVDGAAGDRLPTRSVAFCYIGVSHSETTLIIPPHLHSKNNSVSSRAAETGAPTSHCD
jgi:hypothetical protein